MVTAVRNGPYILFGMGCDAYNFVYAYVSNMNYDLFLSNVQFLGEILPKFSIILSVHAVFCVEG